MSTPEAKGEEGVINRKLVFCPFLQEFPTKDLITTCPHCKNFFIFCCSCRPTYANTDDICHHFRLIFTSGACLQNGQIGATAGVGAAYGTEATSQKSVPVSKFLDLDHPRTSQRAELLAVFAGLQCLLDMDWRGECEDSTLKREGARGPRMSDKTWIIATDSEYVVKGITEWLPTWKNDKLRSKQNEKPANLDLLLRLDAAITAEETRQDLKIGFWHVPREYNTMADKLAKEAAQHGDL